MEKITLSDVIITSSVIPLAYGAVPLATIYPR